MKELIHILKTDFPEKAIDLTDCADLLLETFASIVMEIQLSLNDALSSRDFTRAKFFMSFAEQLNQVEQTILSMRNDLEPELGDEVNDFDSDDVRVLPNYEQYHVDTNVPHSLYENLSHKRPFAFEFLNQRFETRTWIEVLMLTCDLLAKHNLTLFRTFEEDPKLNGRKSKYFSVDASELRKPVRMQHSQFFVETNMNANGVRNLIIKMIQKYGFKVSEMTLYFRADYTELHR